MGEGIWVWLFVGALAAGTLIWAAINELRNRSSGYREPDVKRHGHRATEQPSSLRSKARRPLANQANPMAGFVFKTNRGFFDALCKFGDNTITPSRPLTALVVDAGKEYGIDQGAAVRRQSDGSITLVVEVTSDDGGFRTISSTPPNCTASIRAGDLVAWLPMKLLRNPMTSDPRTKWVGLVVAKLAPEFDRDGPKIVQRL